MDHFENAVYIDAKDHVKAGRWCEEHNMSFMSFPASRIFIYNKWRLTDKIALYLLITRIWAHRKVEGII